MILCQGLKIMIEISPALAGLYLGPDRCLMAVQQVVKWPNAYSTSHLPAFAFRSSKSGGPSERWPKYLLRASEFDNLDCNGGQMVSIVAVWKYKWPRCYYRLNLPAE